MGPQISNKLRELYYNVAQITKWVQNCGLMREKKNNQVGCPLSCSCFHMFYVALWLSKHSPPPISVSVLGHWQECPAFANVGRFSPCLLLVKDVHGFHMSSSLWLHSLVLVCATFCRDPSFLGTSLLWPPLALFIVAWFAFAQLVFHCA